MLGYGCGAVGGLMVRGEPAEQERAIGRAIELGIDYFDTAPMYGDGASERNLGRVLRSLGHPDVRVGTKVLLGGAPPETLAQSLDASLGRLGLERVDLLQLHDPIGDAGPVLEEIAPALVSLKASGKVGHVGFTAIGDTSQLREVLSAGVLETAQVPYNLLNPSAGEALPPGYPAQDYDGLLDVAAETGTGAIGIRVLAGGALRGTTDRHPVASESLEPIGSGADYAADVRRAARLDALVREGHAESLVEAGLRFATGHPALGTVLVGTSSVEQLEFAVAAVERGPLEPAALERLAELRAGFAGEPR